MAHEKAWLSAVIVAAGNSTRMGQPKLLIPLGDRPVIAHTLAAFQACPIVSEIVLATRTEDVSLMREIAARYGVDKLTAVVCGGADRQESVANGIAACRNEAEYLAVHDGARPLITVECIRAVAEAARRDGAAAAAVPVKDTVKIAGADGWVQSTPDRNLLWSVQTPQIFRREWYDRAVLAAETAGLRATDDCGLLEAAGYPVRLVRGEYTNLKITTPEDIHTAEGWL